MALTNYTYSVSSDFPNGAVAVTKLRDQVNADPDIIIGCQYVNIVDDNCDIVMKDPLTNPETASLNQVVANHDGIPYPENQVITTKLVDVDLLNYEDANTMFDGGDDQEGNRCILNVVSGSAVTSWVHVLDHPIEPIYAEIHISAEDPNWEYGDSANFYFYPPNGGVIGGLTAAALSGSTEVSCSSTVIENIKAEFWCKLGTEDFMYKIKDVNTESGVVTLYKGLNEDKDPGDYFFLRVVYLKNWPMWKGQVQRIGDVTPGATHVAAGWTVVIEYNHKTIPTTDWQWYFGLVYLY